MNDNESFIGYLTNIKSFSIPDSYTQHIPGTGPNRNAVDASNSIACLLLYFYTEAPDHEGNVLKKAFFKYEPYFYIICKSGVIEELHQFLLRKFEGKITKVEILEKVDLTMSNHLSGIKRKVIKISFKNVQNLLSVRGDLRKVVQKNKAKEKVLTFTELLNPTEKIDLLEYVEELREDDVQYHVRVCIDNNIRCGKWYQVKNSSEEGCSIKVLEEKLTKNPVTVLAFDIETTKAPLKFPDPKIDSIMLISYMIDGDGYLITNRTIIPEDIEDFQYTPKPEFDGHFQIFNEKNEEYLLKRFVNHCKEVRPNVFVSFNGDMFDIPFIAERLKVYGLTLESCFGLQWVSSTTKAQYAGRFATHIDCLHWVERDAFLPQGSHGLKAVTREKLGYEPIEVDPEKMVQSAKETPKQFCAYSVSDALATYHLYRLMIHDFIFALCTIIPTNPDEVLRAGSGTLCEELLMTKAFQKEIIFPPKQITEFEKFYNSNLIDNETYSGGHVECLNVGIYREDFQTQFNLDPNAYQELLDSTEEYIKFSVEIQDGGSGKKVSDIVNYDTVVNDIKSKLSDLLKIAKSDKEQMLYPKIYHLDVGAMYPNIILTNKLQPVGIVNDENCAKCLYKKDINFCKKKMFWRWRGELFPLNRNEYEKLKKQIEFELYKNNENDDDISLDEYKKLLLKRVKTYCSKTYKKIHVKKEEEREGYVCQRENPFYVDTVRDFRDRRYKFKAKVKEWKLNLESAIKDKNSEKILEAKNYIDLYDSLQLAHKIILNSFYGYVMRKGSRWYSMEMAAMVTYQGSHLITDARLFCQKIGKPLELDTDGIWCCLPNGFPETFNLIFKNGKKMKFIFSQAMLNTKTYKKYHNNQYNEYDNNLKKWIVRPEMSVFFEPDGPYKCMVLPAAKEEGKTLKKRYIVITHEGKMSELKGFELKRRGELKIIKIFQADVFQQFLKGKNLKECYDFCAQTAKRWYSILQQHGKGISDEELLEYIEESRNMSKSVEEYGAQKSTAITCAKRMSDILGTKLLKDKNLCSRFILSKKPLEAPIAERAIPTIIFRSQDSIKRKLLRKWLKDNTIDENIDMRDVIDWEYYKERLAGNILKIVIIPAAMQRIENPFPDIAYPDWVSRMMAQNTHQQKCITNFFGMNIGSSNRIISVNKDIEDFGENDNNYDMDYVESEKNSKMLKNIKINLGSSAKKNNMGKIDMFLKKQEDLDVDMEDNININQSEEKENEPMINIVDDFQGWLTQQKKFWKKFKPEQKIEKKIINKENSNENIYIKYGATIEKAFKTNPIYILQSIEDNSNPGIIKLWVTFGNYFAAINVKIRRKIYINSLQQKVPNVFKRVALSLPRNKPVLNLYEFKLEEKNFKEEFNNFNDYIVKKTIEGVYETKIPLNFEILKSYGNCIVYKYQTKNINFSSNTIFNFEDFDQKSLNKYSNNYDEDKNLNETSMSNIQDHLPQNNIFYLYHSFLKSRHFIVLLDFKNKISYIYIIDSVLNNQTQIPNMKNLILQNISQLNDLNENNDDSFLGISNFEFSTKYYNDYTQAYKEINKILLNAKYGKNFNTTNGITTQPFILILQTHNNIEILKKNGLTSLENEFPILTFNFDIYENSYPALDWIKFAARRLSERVIELPAKYDYLIGISQYCSIPICNISQDSLTCSSDLLFSRILNVSKSVSWYSECGFPDLGGGDINHDFFEEGENSLNMINNPGLYLGYSAEIDINYFAVNAVLQSDKLKNFFGSYELQYFDKKNNNLGETRTNEVNLKKLDDYHLERDEYALGSNAFFVLRNMVQKWYDDILKYSDKCADMLLNNFQRWISSTNSKFYDPVIFRMINRLMNQFFSIFLEKINSFGYEIIYADTKKIIIFNQKSSMEDFELLIKSVKSMSLFENLILDINQYWKVLLYKDKFNYGGLQPKEGQGKNNGDNEEDENNENEEKNDMNENSDDNIELLENSQSKIIAQWSIAKFLPKVLSDDFITIITEYLLKLERFYYFKDKDFIINSRTFYENKKYSIQDANDLINKLESENDEDKKEAIKDFKTFLIKHYITYKMLGVLPNIQLRRRDYEEDEQAQIADDRQLIKNNIKNLTENNNAMQNILNEKNEDEENDSEIEPLYRREDFDDDYTESENDGNNENFEDVIDKNDKKRDTKNYKQVNNNLINDKILKKMENKRIDSIWSYPVKLGTFDIERRTNLAAEYINYICEILGLDNDIESEAKILKINCDKFIHVQEYSKETIFVDPCRTFVLKDIYCFYCNASIEIDFCRDEYYLKQTWECKECQHSIDKNMVEFLLVKKMQNFIDVYFSQDLECMKCREQKSEPLFTLCDCGGKFKGTFVDEFRRNYPNMKNPIDLLKTMKDIANYYEFNILKSLLSEFV